MAIINYTDQLKYTGQGYLDSKMMPVKTYEDLSKIALSQRFEGFTITVLNDGNPQEYWLVGGISNKHWVPKTSTSNDYSGLKLILEDGFIKLMGDDKQLGESINLNDFFPEMPDTPNQPDVVCITSVDYTTKNDNDVEGIFMCFSYSDGTQKYLDMSQFLSNTYKQGEGIIIDGNVISIDEIVLNRITKNENDIANLAESLDGKAEKTYVEELSDEIRNEVNLLSTSLTQETNERKQNIKSLQEQITSLVSNVTSNEGKINQNIVDINSLRERVNALSGASEGSTPDGETIGISDDKTKSLYVKILEKEGNILKKDTNDNGESGLYATIPVFYEDEELI